MKTYGVGTKVYVDTFLGMLKGIAIKLPYHCPNDNMLTVKITSRKNRVYKAGEIVTCSKLHTFPRECYHKTGIFTYRVDDFTWNVEE